MNKKLRVLLVSLFFIQFSYVANGSSKETKIFGEQCIDHEYEGMTAALAADIAHDYLKAVGEEIKAINDGKEGQLILLHSSVISRLNRQMQALVSSATDALEKCLKDRK